MKEEGGRDVRKNSLPVAPLQVSGTDLVLRVRPQRRGDPALQPGQEHHGRPLRSQVLNSSSEASRHTSVIMTPRWLVPCSRCPAGTCDGCAFYFLWESSGACPTCTERDYHQIEGACKAGHQVRSHIRLDLLSLLSLAVRNVSACPCLSPGCALCLE